MIDKYQQKEYILVEKPIFTKYKIGPFCEGGGG